MPDLQEQLNSILSNPEAMSQIAAMAQSLGGGGQTPPPPADPPPSGEPPPAPAPAAPAGNQAPDLSALLGLLGGGNGGGQAPDLDPRMIQLALRLYGEYTAPDDARAALLSALKPFLKPERQATLERAQRAARLSRVIRSAMTLLREEGETRV